MKTKNILFRYVWIIFLFAFPQSGYVLAMDIWMASSYENIFQDELKVADKESFHLVMAKNEAESFQILLRSEEDFTIHSVELKELKGETGVISSGHITYNYVEYVFMSKNSIHQDTRYLIRNGAGFYPDPLSNDTEIEVKANRTQPIWITVQTPSDCKAGVYTGIAEIQTDKANYSVKYTVEVGDVIIPDSHCANFDFMHHQQIAGTWFYDAERGNHPRDVITQLYGWKRWTPQWWELLEDMALKLKQSRCNVLFVNTQQLLLDAAGTDLINGKYSFDWSKFDEYIHFFMDRKVIGKMEGIHFGSTIGEVGKTYKSYILTKNEKGILCSKNVDPMTSECSGFFDQFLPALYEHLKAKGWENRWIQHVGDEAVSDLQHQQYAYYMDKISGLAPGMHCGDPTFSLKSGLNAVERGANVVIPIEELYQEYKTGFDSLKNEGVKIYVYNCCGPGNEWLNRFIDKPVWQQRSLGWLCYKWGIPGWLHWGWNFWVDWFEDSLHTIEEEGFKGDHYSVYPDLKNNKIKNSIRQTAVRDMSEDYELLLILGKKNPEAALELVNEIAVNASGNYTSDINSMVHTRNRLVRAFGEKDGRK